MHIKRSHRDEDMLAEAVTQATKDERIQSYFTKRFREYLRWLEDGSASNLIAYYGLRIPAIILAALVPALVALNLSDVGRVITVILGVIIAATTAVSRPSSQNGISRPPKTSQRASQHGRGDTP